jgi:hypothetical protein
MPQVNIEGVGKVNFPDDYTPERIQFAIENDILPRIKQEPPAAVTAGNALREIPRQVGLAARYGAEGLADVVGIGSEPIRIGLEAIGLPKMKSAREIATSAADAIGLPSPQGSNERVVADVARTMAGAGGMAGAAGKVASTVVSPVTAKVASAMAANPGVQVASSAGSGAAGGAVREAGGGPLEQFGASLVGGLGAAGLTALGIKAYDGIANAIGTLLTPKQNMTQINVTLNQILEQNGISAENIPGMVRAELAHEVKKSLDSGKALNADVIRKIADYGAVGATPTRGSVTLDPVQITQERNLAKLGANSQDPNLQTLARNQNANNKVFIENLNDLGGATANAKGSAAGSRAVDSIAAQDAQMKAAEQALYNRARDSSGRSLDLDREAFIRDAYNSLGKSNKGAFLPEKIKVLLEEIRTGEAAMLDGTKRPYPFNVDVIDNLKSTLATASRSAARSEDGGNAVAAIKQVRDAIERTQPQATAGGASADAMTAFDAARKVSRERFTWQESAPGIAAALDNPNPDRFVQDFILSSSNKGANANVEKLMFDINKNPEARQAVKENVVGYLKEAALGKGVKDEVGNFSQSGYNAALDALEGKLRLFFDKDEIAKLKALGRVSAYEMVQPKGSAVNNSNTAGAGGGMLLNLLDKIGSSKLVSRIPFAEAGLQKPAQNWSMQIGAGNALDVAGAVMRPRASESLPLSSLLGPGLLLASPRAESRNDDKRR